MGLISMVNLWLISLNIYIINHYQSSFTIMVKKKNIIIVDRAYSWHTKLAKLINITPTYLITTVYRIYVYIYIYIIIYGFINQLITGGPHIVGITLANLVNISPAL